MPPASTRILTPILTLLLCTASSHPAAGEEPELVFFRGINFNGPPLQIDGHAWEGREAAGVATSDAGFENHAVPLAPSTDDARATMIRSSIWSPAGRNRVVLGNLPPDEYHVYLYVWEDNDPQTYSVFLQNHPVLENHNSGTAGHWHKLGPWSVTVSDGVLELASSGGHANFSGIELWRLGGPPVPEADPALVQHFDSVVAPLISRNCLGCHNGSDKKGGLDLSRREAAMMGGDSGAVLVAGDTGQSLLWQRIEAGEMPPDATLDEADRDALAAWIAAGATWGTSPIDPYLVTTGKRAGYDWWSLQPLAAATPPAVRDTSWPAGPIDHFILAPLERAALSPSAPAGRRTLIRRLSFDLIGLPPAPEEVEAFVQDESPDAYARLIDRLLDSPHYGERWARRWLDIVRFAESQGFERNKMWPDAWKYRDWVIQSLNDDLPYDQFVRMQLAGDALAPDNPLAVIATGQLVVGPYDLTIQNEGTTAMRAVAREEELEGIAGIVAQTYLGLTVNCARCHDHKFDPVHQAEYYQFAAALGGVRFGERESLSEAGRAESQRQRDELAARLAALKERAAAIEATVAEVAQAAPQPERVGDALQVLYRFDEPAGATVQDRAGQDQPLNLKIGDEKAVRWADGGLVIESPTLIASEGPAGRLTESIKAAGALTVEAWIRPASAQDGPARIVTLSADAGRRNVTLGQAGTAYDVRMRSTATDENGLPSLTAGGEGLDLSKPAHVVYTREASGTARLYVDGRELGNREVGGDLSNWSGDFRFALANELTSDRPWRGTLHLVAVYSRALSGDEVARNHQAGVAGVSFGPGYAEIVAALSPELRREYDQLVLAISQIESRRTLLAGGSAHVVTPRQPELFRVLARGDYRQPGQVVSAGGIKALAGVSADFEQPPDAPEAQRRVRLAQWITNPNNPLVARVIVNRLWQYHFGVGLVHTPNDFGFNGGRPSHPELLDWLAAELVRRGWSLKSVHREILLSAAYRQSSAYRSEPAAVDADNRLLWRKSPLRLEAEDVRDAMLAMSGELNPTMGGPGYRDFNVKTGLNEVYEPFDAVGPQYNRRSIYRTWVRSGTNPLLDVLDCPDPTVATPKRTVTTTPLQALSLLNNPLVNHAAGKMAARLQREAGDDAARQVALAWQLVYARPPTAEESASAERFASEFGLDQFCLALFNSNEFLYLD